MKNWKKKPVVIQAIVWDGTNISDVVSFCGSNATFNISADGDELIIATLEDGKNGEAKHVATVGDYIIRGVKGEYYPCKPDIFALTYEEAGLPTDKEMEDVRSFHNKFDILDAGTTPTLLTKRKLTERIECMQEELDEFKAAVEAQDFAEQADALIDLVYFTKGTAVMMGLPWSQLWDDVQRANMDKVRGVGKRGHAVDMIKPEGWQKPNGAGILEVAGFDVDKFKTDGVVDEAKCLDDKGQI